ncbi:NAD(P)H-dependent oxidoreductase [Kiloniella laminariae]|uniref:NAD(P)H-dependent oxidoreductase n=1 Tax=Kiloniella laminariae TaxID=454162 RepID=A0ABT4LDK5_9PROT|nr:NADPH-dependent FMN reductase [Kiloniella laminariae]MCZ4279179.1 NAD(P)H-dependent oxidoreductase [Kiloniella laminariae]
MESQSGLSQKTRVLALVGSLREKSYNRALLREAIAVAPEGIDIVVFDRLAELPLFNEDLEAVQTPEVAQELKQAIMAVDALLIVTPEYNSGLPAVLKNGIDWASRGTPSVFANLAVGIMGTSPGAFGTARVQAQLKQSLGGLGAYPLAAPDFVLPLAKSKFDDDLKITDEATRTRMTKYLERLGELAVCLAAIRKR